jgi:thiol-disulfide isomerase/thioredoxin
MLRAILFFVLSFFAVTAVAESYELEMPDLKGHQHKLSDYRGKWVVINYWATWCPPCLEEIPELVEFHDKHHLNKAVVLGIDYEEADHAYLKTFVEENFISYPILLPDLKVKPPFGKILGLPTTFVIAPNGKLAATRVGGVTREWLEAVTTSTQVTSGE